MVKAPSNKNYITPRGYRRLRREQDYLIRVERPKIVEEVAYAASLGDRSENAEYIYGKKRLRAIDRRLGFLDRRIRIAEVVDPAQDRGDVVYFGATVMVEYADGRERTFDLVGVDEIEPDRDRISWRSPMGRALMRKREGDEVQVSVGEEVVELEIVEVIYQAQTPDDESKPPVVTLR